MYTLYYAPGAASMAVHWLLIDMELPHALALVDLDARQQQSPDYLALNPNGVVPTLLVDGVAHGETAALLMLLGERHPQSGLVPTVDDPDRAALLQWMFHLANVVQPLFRQWWYPHEPAGEAQAGLVRQHVTPRIEAAWRRLDTQLAARGPYALGDRPSVADFHLTMLMRWSRGMPITAVDWPHLAALAQRMKARPSFAELYAREGLSEWR